MRAALVAVLLLGACATDPPEGAVVDAAQPAADSSLEPAEAVPVTPPVATLSYVWPALITALATTEDTLYVAGDFRDAFELGDSALEAGGVEEDVFLASLTLNGDVRWAARYGSERDDQIADVAASETGVVVAGSVKSPIDFGGGLIGSGNKEAAFVAAFDADGAYRWAHVWGNGAWNEATCLAVDGQGNAVVGGIVRDTMSFGGDALTSEGGGDVFVASFDASGAHRWSRAFGGEADDRAVTVNVDGPGNVYLTGLFQATTNYPDAVLTEDRPGWSDLFILGLAPDGTHRWANTFGDVGPIDLESAVIGPDGLVFAGSVLGNVDLGGALLDSDDSTAGKSHHTRDVVTARFGLDGAHQASASFSGLGQEWGKEAGVDAAGNTYTAGWYSESYTLAGVEHPNAGALDTFVLSRTPAGVRRWSIAISGSGEDRVSAMAVTGGGDIYLAGRFEDTVDVAGAALVAGETWSGFLVRLQ